METPKKSNAQNTSTTLKKCLENPLWRKAYEFIKRESNFLLKNHYYDDLYEE